MQKRLIYLIISATLALTGCAMHYVEVPQGNVIRADALAQLKQGMTSSQVTYLLGTPMIKDPFHANQWDYVYTTGPGKDGKTPPPRRLTLYFENDILKRIEVEKTPPAKP